MDSPNVNIVESVCKAFTVFLYLPTLEDFLPLPGAAFSLVGKEIIELILLHTSMLVIMLSLSQN